MAIGAPRMEASVFRKNSRLKRSLEEHGATFISYVLGAIQRILPHVEQSNWIEGGWAPSGSVWTSSSRTAIRFTITFGDEDGPKSRSLSALIRRRGDANKTLDMREYDICRKIFERISEIAGDMNGRPLNEYSSETIAALRNSFDAFVVAKHLEEHFSLQMPVGPVFSALRQLSEQTYENKALVFGCLLGGEPEFPDGVAAFPRPFLESKKYKALSDGYRTAYEVSNDGQISGFVELDGYTRNSLTEKHFFPDWSESLARASLTGRCAIALTRQGDILVFDRGVLRFTYRYGKWQYWNHTHVVGLLRDRAKAQKVPKHVLGRVVGTIYRVALDVSFRRSGGLFVVLHRKTAIHEIVRAGDAIGDPKRAPADAEFDRVVGRHKMQSLPRSVAVELASLDGAVVLANSGEILAYGAVLQPKRAGHTSGAEGSRTKAAIGASNYCLAVKVSSDGDISVYHHGEKFISI